MTELGEFGMWVAIGAGQIAFWVALHPLISALADRIRHRGSPGPEVDERLRALEQRSPVTGEADLVHQRLLELEERLDFAERFLARPGEGDRLPAGPADPAATTPIGGAR